MKVGWWGPGGLAMDFLKGYGIKFSHKSFKCLWCSVLKRQDCSQGLFVQAIKFPVFQNPNDINCTKQPFWTGQNHYRFTMTDIDVMINKTSSISKT